MNGGGGGPSQGFLAQLGAALQMNGQSRAVGGDVNGVDPFAAGAAAAGIAPPPPPPATPPSMGAYGGGSSVGGAPIVLPGVQPAPLPPMQGPAEFPPGQGPAGGLGALPSDERVPRDDVEIRSVGGGGGTPAHEAMNKGPVQLGHYMAAFDHQENAAESQNLRTQMQASHEEAMYAEAAHAAQEREVQAKATLVRRQEEMRRTETEFRSQVDMLSQQHLDQGRLFANMGTGDKIVTTLLLGLGSLGGGPNPVVEALNKKIDRDLDAQKFDYDTGMNRAKGLHSAYSMLMNRYHEEDIALAGARVAALDFVLAKTKGMDAQWKGTESANTLDAIRGKLGADRENTLGNAMTLVAATAGGGGNEVYVRGRGGMRRMPGLKTDKEAGDILIKHDTVVNEKFEDEQDKGRLARRLEEQRAQHALEKSKAADGKDAAKVGLMNKATLDAIDSAMEPASLKRITEPGLGGAAVDYVLPSSWNEGNSNRINDREAYNTRAITAIAGMYKLGSMATEPRAASLIAKLNDPFLIKAGDNEATARNKMQNLRTQVANAAAGHGVTPPDAAAAAELSTFQNEKE